MDKKLSHCLGFQSVDVVILVGQPLVGGPKNWEDDFDLFGISEEIVHHENGSDLHLPRILVRAGLFPSTSAVRKFVPGKLTGPQNQVWVRETSLDQNGPRFSIYFPV